MKDITKTFGTVIPLGALRTEKCPAIGEFSSLKAFASFCKQCGIRMIQLLPVNDSGTQSSPYSALSAFALHPIYITLSEVEGYKELIKKNPDFQNACNWLLSQKDKARYDYQGILNTKNYILRTLYEETDIFKKGKLPQEIEKWVSSNSWVKPYSVYKNLKWKYMQKSWKEWPKQDRFLSKEEIISRFDDTELVKEHFFYIWQQYIADAQFSDAVKACKKEGLSLKGDLPILMNEDSCDAWFNPDFFNQKLRAGSPADGDNPTGQNWGFPTYNWTALAKDDYSWWISRLKSAEKYYDAYRLDHILGFFRIWAIPETEANALNGHTEPCATFKAADLEKLGFGKDRIRWLSKPHIPTKLIDNITWNHDMSVKILETFCNRIGNEDLWLFKDNFTPRLMYDTDISEFCTSEAQNCIKEILNNKWSDRCFVEPAKNKLYFSWIYQNSTAWKTLNNEEKEKLNTLHEQLEVKQNKLWKKSADEILSKLTSSVEMVPCGEDLGVGLSCVAPVMKKNNILGLKVVRWCREWDKEGQPFFPVKKYEPLSVCTTSVHDSSTLREWAETETEDKKFTPAIAAKLLKNASKASSIYFIPPLQDLLYMDKKLWLKKAKDERINIPGTVTDFNWTYRLPCTVEELCKNDVLIEKIKGLC